MAAWVCQLAAGREVHSRGRYDALSSSPEAYVLPEKILPSILSHTIEVSRFSGSTVPHAPWLVAFCLGVASVATEERILIDEPSAASSRGEHLRAGGRDSAGQPPPATAAASLYGHNLIVNGNAEAGPGAQNDSTFISPPGGKTPGLPGTKGLTVASYTGSSLTSPEDVGNDQPLRVRSGVASCWRSSGRRSRIGIAGAGSGR